MIESFEQADRGELTEERMRAFRERVRALTTAGQVDQLLEGIPYSCFGWAG